ncbi:NUDIX domain-containing protein [bacterium]|nr:NUDIX domain-containing protein [bacterium]
MRSILVVERRHLFPGLSPQGFLSPDAVDLAALAPHLFFAERDYMETCAHYKQIIPYLMLVRGHGDQRRVLAYQRRTKHTEARLGGLWSVGFGGHVEPLDRTAPDVAAAGLIGAAARRELAEETGLAADRLELDLAGIINSDREDVSSVHLGLAFTVDLDGVDGPDDDLLASVMAQAEPHRALWIPARELPDALGEGRGPDRGTFEDWSRIVIEGGALAG